MNNQKNKLLNISRMLTDGILSINIYSRWLRIVLFIMISMLIILMWGIIFIIIPVSIIICILCANLYDHKLNTNEVEIRIIEAYNFASDDYLYKCQFRKIGGVFWRDLVRYSNLLSRVIECTEQSPKDFNQFKGYSYSQCIEYNKKAYEKEESVLKKRKSMECTKLQ